MRRNLVGMHKLFSALVVSVVCSTGAAATSYYGELLTPLGGGRATLSTDFAYGSFSGAEWLPALPNGGLVTGDAPLSFTHTFAPGVGVASIQSAYLYIGLVDDGAPFSDFIVPNEYARIALDSNLWGSGQGVLNVIHGAVSLSAFALDGQFVVTVSSANRADFRVAGSLFKVKFESAAPIPEPSAIIVFTLGGLLVAGMLWRRQGALRD